MGNPNPAKKFEPGHDPRRNMKGRPPKLPDLDFYIAKILNEEKEGVSGIEAMVRRLHLEAVKGDMRAAEILLERAYGKPKGSEGGVHLHLDGPVKIGYEKEQEEEDEVEDVEYELLDEEEQPRQEEEDENPFD